MFVFWRTSRNPTLAAAWTYGSPSACHCSITSKMRGNVSVSPFSNIDKTCLAKSASARYRGSPFLSSFQSVRKAAQVGAKEGHTSCIRTIISSRVIISFRSTLRVSVVVFAPISTRLSSFRWRKSINLLILYFLFKVFTISIHSDNQHNHLCPLISTHRHDGLPLSMTGPHIGKCPSIIHSQFG